jgi:Tol biopolymer transport system component/DNA-binding winged helix-turn-helix (wHTH) protein
MRAVKRLYEFGPFRLDTYRGVLLREGEIVDVTPKVVDLLQVLIENNRQIVPREDLLSEVWPDTVVDEANINRTVSMLRRALAEAVIEDCIETIPKRGYRFTAEVREIEPGTVTVERVTRAEVTIKEESESRWPWVLGIVSLVIVLAVVAIYRFSRRTPAESAYPLRLTNNRASDDLPTWSPDGSRIAFTSNREGKNEIYVMRADGSDVKRLTFASSDDSGATWSPDGSKLAFTSNRDGNAEIYVMNSDGSNQKRLTTDGARDVHPVWSPDGSQLVFASNRNNSNPYNFDVYVMNADGSNPTRLTDDPEFDADPVWSPDGKHIAFTSARKGQFEIFVMDADGSNQRSLTTGASPAWSPDGSRIAFASRRGGRTHIYIIDPDGSNEIQLTFGAANETWPSWSPDGQIVFESDRDGNTEIYVIKVDELTRLTEDVADDIQPAWSPDGKRIAFASRRDGDFEIYSMDSDGQNQRRLTRTAEDDMQPVWSPDGRRIAFTSERDGRKQIYVMNADGSGARRLTNDSMGCAFPAWSHDGRKLACSCYGAHGGSIDVMNADGSGRIRLTDKPDSIEPSWSADGTKIAFASNHDVHYQLFAIDVSGKQTMKLTPDPPGYVGPPWHDSSEPAWSPDGKHIAFRKVIDDLGANMKIFVMNADGSHVVRVTHNPAIDRNPAWSPDGKKIAFQSNRRGNFDIYVVNVPTEIVILSRADGEGSQDGRMNRNLRSFPFATLRGQDDGILIAPRAWASREATGRTFSRISPSGFSRSQIVHHRIIRARGRF